MLDRVTTSAKPLDLRRVNAKACRHWPTVHSHLVDLHGRIVGSVLAELNPEAARRIAAGGEKRRALSQFKLIDETSGSWRDLGSGRQGESIIELVQFLAHDCPRHDAAGWLDNLTSRIVEVAA
jgi:hypothetical protein